MRELEGAGRTGENFDKPEGELEETMGGVSELEEDRGSWKQERERKGAGELAKTKGNLMKPGEREGTLGSCKVCREDLGERSARRWKMEDGMFGLWSVGRRGSSHPLSALHKMP